MQASTEYADERYAALDLWPSHDVAAAILTVQRQALAALEPTVGAVAAAIDALAERLRRGGRMAYAGAGSSGLLAQMDALELPGTYGIAADRLPVILAGGPDSLHCLPAGAEDDVEAGEAAVEALGLGPADGLIAVAASGSTPFTLAALRTARRRGAVTVGIACAPATPLLDEGHHAILAATPPEVVAGSTRMGAGTAQKCALNMLSTGVGVRLGHAYAGRMVNMMPANAKLRARAVATVAAAAGVASGEAERALTASDWSVKVAVVACAGRLPPAAARDRLAKTAGDIRAALEQSPG